MKKRTTNYARIEGRTKGPEYLFFDDTRADECRDVMAALENEQRKGARVALWRRPAASLRGCPFGIIGETQVTAPMREAS